ncbi:hypothetical protein cand_009390 [Cryptosporidium andersoni]|uniref:Chromatin target of PRMT1 protein C-terminal domain-containing protein n=1 Tax=Cryptosporidium andersoni TaxID=117008 RepID=A0A1J4MTD7_9CRYT|nr:hypothetical protein cand_009390 [Cryptosporidium andersoni]
MVRSFGTKYRGNFARGRGISGSRRGNSLGGFRKSSIASGNAKRKQSLSSSITSRSRIFEVHGGRRVNTSIGRLNKRRILRPGNNRNITNIGKPGFGRRQTNIRGKFSTRGNISNNVRRGRSGMRGGRGKGRNGKGNNRMSQKTTMASLDAALDSYMGVDACKARLDSQLDSYFSGQIDMSGNDNVMASESSQQPSLITL